MMYDKTYKAKLSFNPLFTKALEGQPLHGGFRGGMTVHYPRPQVKLRGGGYEPLYFYKVITPKAFDLEQVKLERMTMNPKSLASISDSV